MSKTTQISSAHEFKTLLGTSKVVVADFYADWCGPCKAIAPLYEQLSEQLSRTSKVTFTKVNVDEQKDIAAACGVTAMPTFLIFKNSKLVETIRGADPRKLQATIRKFAAEADSDGSTAAGGYGEAAGDSTDGWVGASLPKGYANITDQVDLKSLDLLNADSQLGSASTLFDRSKPSALADDKGKGKTGEGEAAKDWVESDTDEQLMLYIPFHSIVKIRSIHVTSLPPRDGESGTMRPKTIQFYSNRPHILGFEEADDIPALQSVTLNPRDWDAKTHTAQVELRFVKFQNASSLVIFIVDGEGDGEKVRVDRLRVIGESGEKRELGKLEKIGDLPGE